MVQTMMMVARLFLRRGLDGQLWTRPVHWTLLAIACLIVIAPSQTRAQCGDQWAPGLDASPLSGDYMRAIQCRNGDIVVWRARRTDSIPLTGLDRYSPQTGHWTNIGFGFDDFGFIRISAVVELPNGELLVAGTFPQENGQPESHETIRRFGDDGWILVGTVDDEWATIWDIVPLNDGTYAVFGDFEDVNHTPGSRGIVRYSPATDSFSSMETGPGTLQSDVLLISSLGVLANGDLYAAGLFASPGNQQHVYGLVAYSAVNNTWSEVAGTSNISLYNLRVLGNGDLIANTFPSIHQPPDVERCVIRSAQSGQWSDLIPSLPGYTPTSIVNPLGTLPNGDLLAAAAFQPNGDPYQAFGWLLAFDPSTGQWSRRGDHISWAVSFFLPNASRLSEGRFLITGTAIDDRRVVDGEPINALVFDSSTDEWGLLGNGLGGPPSAMTMLSDGDVLVGGDLYFADRRQVARLARFNPRTKRFSRFDPDDDAPYGIRAMLTLANGDVVLGGRIYQYNRDNQLIQGVGLIHPSETTARPLSCPCFQDFLVQINALAATPGGDIVVGGNFFQYDYDAGTRIAGGVALYSPALDAWDYLDTGVDNVVYAVTTLENGDIVVGGDFRYAGGLPIGGIARFSTSTGQWTRLGSGLEQAYDLHPVVNSIFKLASGELLVEGSFTSAGGIPIESFHWAVYSPQLDRWRAVPAPIGASLAAAAILPSGDIAVSSMYDGVLKYSINTGESAPLGGGTSNLLGYDFAAFPMLTLPNGDLLLGGGFTIAGDRPSSYFAHYVFNGPHIVAQPQYASVCMGDTAQFATAATATGPMTFQWRKDGAAIDPASNPSAATPTLTIQNVQPGDAGQIDCLISDDCDAAASTSVLLAILPPWSTRCGGSGCDADLNQDGNADQGDIDYLINVAAGRPNPSGIEPDFNHDGNVDQGDIDALINVVAGGVCP